MDHSRYVPPGAETIVTAAIKHGDVIVTVERPGRHHNIFHEMHRLNMRPPAYGAQGFTTSTGRFVDRQEALRIAQAADQIQHKHGRADELYSEDLW